MRRPRIASCSPFPLLAFGASLFVATTSCSSSPVDASHTEADDLEALSMPGVDERLLDRSADPCKDFYAFACGNYPSTVAPGAPFASRFGDLTKQRNEIARQVQEGILSAPRNEAERKAGAFITTCLQPVDMRSRDYMVGFRREIEAATSKSDILRLTARMQKRMLSWSAPFFQFIPQLSTARVSSVGVQPGGFNFFGTDYSTAEGVAKRVDDVVKAMRVVDPQMFESDATRIATASVAIEHALVDAAQTEPEWKARPLGRVGLESIAPSLDWSAYFNTLGAPDDLGSFPVWNFAFFGAVDSIVAAASLTDLKAYLVARWYAPIATLFSNEDRGKLCTGYLTSKLADVIEPRFLELAGIDDAARGKARTLYHALVATFAQELREAPFLDAPTRAEALVKLSKMGKAIAASPNLEDLRGYDIDPDATFLSNNLRLNEHRFARALEDHDVPPDLEHIDFPVMAVNAAYVPTDNRVMIPGGILGGFFFSPSAPGLANFAAIGSVMGHEMTHGFDNRGRQYDATGGFRDWWSAGVNAEYERRSQCLVNQYNAFELPGVTVPGRAGPAHVNGKQTISENIADAGGLKLAYRSANPTARRGRSVAGFTPPQQFFLGYGQVYCEVRSNEIAVQQLAFDPHSPGRARVNVPLSNFEPFAEAFQCTAGTPMAPANRCAVW